MISALQLGSRRSNKYFWEGCWKRSWPNLRYLDIWLGGQRKTSVRSPEREFQGSFKSVKGSGPGEGMTTREAAVWPSGRGGGGLFRKKLWKRGEVAFPNFYLRRWIGLICAARFGLGRVRHARPPTHPCVVVVRWRLPPSSVVIRQPAGTYRRPVFTAR